MATAADVVAAIEAGDADALARTLGDDPELAAANNDKGVSALLLAQYRGRADLVELVGRHRPRLDVFEAAAFGDLHALRALLDDDARRAEQWSADGYMPLHLAAFIGRLEAAELLLDSGGRPQRHGAQRDGGQATAQRGRGTQQRDRGAARARGPDVNGTQRHGFTALHAAAQHGDREVVRFLVAHGAEVTATDDEGRTPAEFAKRGGHAEIERFLRAEAASESEDV